MTCSSGRSLECTGNGSEVWNGMCSNCADEAAKPTVVRNQKINKPNAEKVFRNTHNPRRAKQ